MTVERMRRLAAHAAKDGPESVVAIQRLRRLARFDLRIAAFLAWGPRTVVEVAPADATRAAVWERLGRVHDLSVDADPHRIRVLGNPLDLFDAWTAWSPLDRSIELLHGLLGLSVLRDLPAAPASSSEIIVPEAPEDAVGDWTPGPPAGPPEELSPEQDLAIRLGDDTLALVEILQEGWEIASQNAGMIQWPARLPSPRRQIEQQRDRAVSGTSLALPDRRGPAPIEAAGFQGSWEPLTRDFVQAVFLQPGLHGKIELPQEDVLLDPHGVLRCFARVSRAGESEVHIKGHRFQAVAFASHLEDREGRTKFSMAEMSIHLAGRAANIRFWMWTSLAAMHLIQGPLVLRFSW